MNEIDLTKPVRDKKTLFLSRINIAFTITLLFAGLWYLIAKITLVEIWQALTNANIIFIILSLSTVLATLLLKIWRWQYMYPEFDKPPSFSVLSWSMLLGAYINILLPFLRLGEIARIFTLNTQTHINKMQILGTLVLEKTLDILTLGLVFILVTATIVTPIYLSQSSIVFTLIAIALISLTIFYIVALYTEETISAINSISSRFLPTTFNKHLTHWITTGTSGFAALRSVRHTTLLIGFSLIIVVTSVAAPMFLFYAFHIPLGWIEAAIIFIVVSLALVPPTTPGKIGLLDGVVAFLLIQFGLDNQATIASYTIIYHLILILPLIILGSIAVSRTNWQWRIPTKTDVA